MAVGQRNGSPSAIGARVVAQFKADAERRRNERTERMKSVVAERLREIQNSQKRRPAKGGQ